MAIVCLQKLVNTGVNIVGVVPPHRENPTYDYFMQFANAYNLPVIDYHHSFKDPVFLNKIRFLEPDIAVVCSYNKLFPKEFLSVTKDGFINIHPSLLPEYRGGNPYSHVIINDEKETGITLHFMDEHFDTGDMISQFRTPIEKHDTMGTIFNRLNYMGADALFEALAYYEVNSTLPRRKQPEGQFKKAPLIDTKYGNTTIDWSKPVVEIERFIRALNPFICAVTSFRNVFVKVYGSQAQLKSHKSEPGTICNIKGTVGVACGDGILHIKLLQVGSYLVGDSKDFITVFKPKIGEKFE